MTTDVKLVCVHKPFDQPCACIHSVIIQPPPSYPPATAPHLMYCCPALWHYMLVQLWHYMLVQPAGKLLQAASPPAAEAPGEVVGSDLLPLTEVQCRW